jgi:hypothetical protein
MCVVVSADSLILPRMIFRFVFLRTVYFPICVSACCSFDLILLPCVRLCRITRIDDAVQEILRYLPDASVRPSLRRLPDDPTILLRSKCAASLFFCSLCISRRLLAFSRLDFCVQF